VGMIKRAEPQNGALLIHNPPSIGVMFPTGICVTQRGTHIPVTGASLLEDGTHHLRFPRVDRAQGQSEGERQEAKLATASKDQSDTLKNPR